jgi:D-alanyl-D-alanine dipeptidase
MQCQEKHQQTFDRGRQVDITFYGEKYQQTFDRGRQVDITFYGEKHTKKLGGQIIGKWSNPD